MENSIVIIPVIIFAIYTTITTNKKMEQMYSLAEMSSLRTYSKYNFNFLNHPSGNQN